jgi:meso-butanediol dehydrogenase/(S,S)-butanediol dehydrogenase/diacetyl reductase
VAESQSSPTALISGAARGIGLAVAQQLAMAGANTVLVDIDEEAAEEAARKIRNLGFRATSIRCDVTDPDDVRNAVTIAGSEQGRLDYVVSNVGIALEASFEELSLEEWNFQIGASLTGSFLLLQAATPHLISSPIGGRVVLIGSVNGMTGFGHEAYSAAKAGLANLMQNLAVRLGTHGVRVNMVSPATILTEVWQERVATDPDLLARMSAHYPLGRLGRPEDVANAVGFLLSDEAAWITGVVLPVDGGLMAGNLAMVRDRRIRQPEESG